jgi:ankyrin repeat protein
MTPLLFAVYEGRENVVNMLVKAGCNISLRNAGDYTPKALAEVKNYNTIVTFLAQRDEDGPLVENVEELSSAVDKDFEGTIVDFYYSPGIHEHHASVKPVDELLENPRHSHDRNKGAPSFRWIHLPANNVISRIQWYCVC